MSDPTCTENDSVIQLARELADPRALMLARGNASEAQVLLVPKGFDVHRVKPLLDEYLQNPERRRGTTVLTDPASFVAFVLRAKNEHTVIYAADSDAAPSLLAVLDHDERGADGVETARWGQHRATHAIGLSAEWKAWMKADNAALSQRDFAELIEERALDLVDPSEVEGHDVLKLAERLGIDLATSQEVIEASRGLKLRAEVNVGEAITLSSGETELHYAEAHKGVDGQPLKVPSAFLIGVPVLKGGVRDVLLVRLRYRRVSGQPRVAWCTVLHHPDEVQRHAIAELIASVKEQTGVEVFFGAPPASK